MNEVLSKFRDEICASGLEPPIAITPGQFHRFPGRDKSAGNTAAWCMLFDDGLGGCFGDWSTGLAETWLVDREKPLSVVERTRHLEQLAKAKRQANANKLARQAEAAIEAESIWHEAAEAPANHPYLRKKRIRPNGARLHDGHLVVPVTDFRDGLTSLQFIHPNGSKRLLTGGRKKGCFIPVAGDLATAHTVVVCEGWATGCTLAAEHPEALVLAAVDAGNLELVALGARRRWPWADLVVAGDDDRLTPGNPGATKARAAALASGAKLALPAWPVGAPQTLTDFNDLARWQRGCA